MSSGDCVDGLELNSVLHHVCIHGMAGGDEESCPACRPLFQVLRDQCEASELRRSRLGAIFEHNAGEISRLADARRASVQRLYELHPREFEIAVAELFRRVGFDVDVTSYIGDGGKDAIMRKDGKTYLMEAKKWGPNREVGSRNLRIFFSALDEYDAAGGYFVTSGSFHRSAREYEPRIPIQLIDAKALDQLAREHFEAEGGQETYTAICPQCSQTFSTSLRSQSDEVRGV